MIRWSDILIRKNTRAQGSFASSDQNAGDQYLVTRNTHQSGYRPERPNEQSRQALNAIPRPPILTDWMPVFYSIAQTDDLLRKCM